MLTAAARPVAGDFRARYNVPMTDEPRRRLTRNPWLGVMWGPVPIGLIALIVLLSFVFVYFYVIAD